jgi:hypothetical protein
VKIKPVKSCLAMMQLPSDPFSHVYAVALKLQRAGKLLRLGVTAAVQK